MINIHNTFFSNPPPPADDENTYSIWLFPNQTLYTSCTFNFKPSVGRNKMNKAGMHGRLQRGDTVKFFCRTAIKVKHSFLLTLAPAEDFGHNHLPTLLNQYYLLSSWLNVKTYTVLIYYSIFLEGGRSTKSYVCPAKISRLHISSRNFLGCCSLGVVIFFSRGK